MSDPIMSRILELETRFTQLANKHNDAIDTTHKLFENQTDLIMAIDKKYDLVRTLLTEVLELMKNHVTNKETTK